MRYYILKFIQWYLIKKCGGAFHINPYGEKGRYVVIMNERQYHNYKWKAEDL